jgi:hypothetical protein
MLLFYFTRQSSNASLLSQLNNVNTFIKIFCVKKQQGSIWQLLTMGQKAAKLPNYCILLWRLNAQKKVGYSFEKAYLLAFLYIKLSPIVSRGTCSVMLSPKN